MSHDPYRWSNSLAVLREQGPMTLRDLTRATAKRMRYSLTYADVAAVMGRHELQGLARCERADDYRDHLWSAYKDVV